MYHHAEVDTPCSDNMQIVRFDFGPPASNDISVRDAVQAIEQINSRERRHFRATARADLLRVAVFPLH